MTFRNFLGEIWYPCAVSELICNEYTFPLSHQMSYSEEQFVAQLIKIQPQLYGYILSLLANCNDADDLVQRTNVILLKKKRHFKEGTDFWAWAKQVAIFEVRGFRKEMARNRVILSETLVTQLVSEESELLQKTDIAKAALRSCLSGVDAARRQLLERRYGGESVAQLAKALGRSAAAVSQELYRIRIQLARCIEFRMGSEKD